MSTVRSGWWRRRGQGAWLVLALAPLGAPAHAAPAAPRRASAASPTLDIAATRAIVVGADLDAAARAATALGAVTDPAAHAALLDALATGLSPRVAAAALAAVAAQPRAGDAAVVRLYAVHRNPAARAAALAAMAASPVDADSRRLLVAALGDEQASVRAAAADAVARARVRDAIPRLLALLARGDDPAAPALASLADADVARQIGELLGTAPDALLSRCLGQLLLRRDFGPDSARVQVVRTLAKAPGPDAVTALTQYLDATAADPPRPSRREAEAAVQLRQERP